MVLAVNLVARFKRAGRFMIGLGVDSARALAGDSNPELSRTLAATSQLSRTVIWELRRSIDAGRIFEGRGLGTVLREYTETFQRITAVPTRMVRSGTEPELSMDTRTRLFSITHNVLTNALRHSDAGSVNVVLEFSESLILLTVEDDGVGLPANYAQRGRGFASSRAEAERMGGSLVVASGGPGEGTSGTCEIPVAATETTGSNVPH